MKTELKIMPLPYGPFDFYISDFDDDQWGLSEGNGNGVLEWGEKCEILVNVVNKGNKTVNDSRLEIISLNPQAMLGLDFVKIGKIDVNDEEGASGIFCALLLSVA